MLNITNGDSAIEPLRSAGLSGEIIPWRDILHEGPPGAGPAERAAFLAATEPGLDADAIRRDLEVRDERLARALRDGEEIVLWFEADLYDVLQVLQILSRVPGASLALAGLESWASIQDPPLPEPVPVTGEQLSVARAAWAAICSGDPRHVEAIDGAALPGLAPALRRWLEQLPWTTDGLTRSERALLRAIAEGARSRTEAFVAAQAQEERPFLGDLTASAYLDRLASGPTPLVDATTGPGPDLALTDAGRAVLAGTRVWDRPEATPWQWDPLANCAVTGP